MTVSEGTTPIFKIHADGKTEVGSGGAPAAAGAAPEVKWSEGPSVAPDGTISFKGTEVARIEQDGTIKNLRTGQVIPVKLGTDTLTVQQPGGEMTLQIQEDGTIPVPGAKPEKALHVQGAADAETRRTAIGLVGAIFLSGKSQPPPPPAQSGAAPPAQPGAAPPAPATPAPATPTKPPK